MKCTQQDEVYAAERCVPSRRFFATIDEAGTWMNEARDTAWFRTGFPQVEWISVIRRDDRCDASVGGWVEDLRVVHVEMLDVHLTPLTLCHEVAHGLAQARWGSRSHDPWFARTYLTLVWLMVGPEAYAELRNAFVTHGVDHDPGPEFDILIEGVRHDA